MKERFKPNRGRVLNFDVSEYLAVLGEYFDKASETITVNGFANFLGVTKITKIKRFESDVFVFYEDRVEDYDTYYRIDEKFRLEDAYNALSHYFGGDDGYKILSKEEVREFMAEFGFDVEDLFNEESEHYVLNKMTDYFADQQDCNVPENSTWENIINQVITELKNA